jgi:hypothetical protein
LPFGGAKFLPFGGAKVIKILRVYSIGGGKKISCWGAVMFAVMLCVLLLWFMAELSCLNW